MSTFPSHELTLKGTEFSALVQQTSGLNPLEPICRKTNNVCQLLKHREMGMYKTFAFSEPTKCKLANNFIPNSLISSQKVDTGITRNIFSPNGNMFLTTSDDGKLKLWNPQNGSYKLCQKIDTAHNSAINDVSISPNNNWIACVNNSSYVFVYYLNNGNPLSEPKTLIYPLLPYFYNSFSNVRFSSNGYELLLTDAHNILIFSMKIDALTLEINDTNIRTATFADNTSQIIYSGGCDNLIKIWDRRTLIPNHPKPVGVLTGHLNYIIHIDSKGDGRHLLSKSYDQSIKLWDIRSLPKRTRSCSVDNSTWKPLSRFGSDSHLNKREELDMSLMTYAGAHLTSKFEHTEVRFSPLETTGHRFIYTGCCTGDVVVYDALTGALVALINEVYDLSIYNVTWHPNRNEILRTSMEGTLTRWMYSE